MTRQADGRRPSACVLRCAALLVALTVTSFAATTQEPYDREKTERVSDILATLALTPGMRVADIGAGDGFYTLKIAAVIAPGRVTGGDINEKSLERMRQHLSKTSLTNVDVVLGTPADPLLPADSFDAILIHNAYHEFVEHQTMLGHIHKALNSTGRLVLVEPFGENAQLSRNEQVAKHNIDSSIAARELAEANFEIVERQEKFITFPKGDGGFWLIVARKRPAGQASACCDSLARLDYLLGRWAGTQEGQPGSGTVTREYTRELNGRFIRATNRSVYPAQPKNPKGEIHEDVGYFGLDRSRKLIVFRQFHTEGFVVQYVWDTASTGSRVVMTSEAIENIPKGYRARETYIQLSPDEVEEIFEMAEPNQYFKVYSHTRLKRVK
jgi:precorrin-6B methylase 2